MTAIVERPAPKRRASHPVWCTAVRGETAAGCTDSSTYPEHFGRETVWTVGRTELRIAAYRSDEFDVETSEQDSGEPQLMLSISDVESTRVDGCEIRADVSLAADDCELLIRFLRQHMTECRRVRLGDIPDEMCRARRADDDR